jgi:hypothetical protein
MQTVINRTIAASNMVVLVGVGRTLFVKSKGDANYSQQPFLAMTPILPMVC